MEHGIGSGSPAPGCQARTAEGVMVRRLSVASLDSGAESPVYGEEPSAAADHIDPEVKPQRVGDRRWAVWPARVELTGNGKPMEFGVPPCASKESTSLQVPRGGLTRDITVT